MNERLIEVIPCMYEDAWPIKDGVAEVKENGEWKKIKIEELDMLDKRKEKYRSLLARRKTYRQIKEHYNMDR